MSISNKFACVYSEDSNQSVQSESLNFPNEERLDPWLPNKGPSKTDQTAQQVPMEDSDQTAWMCRLI